MTNLELELRDLVGHLDVPAAPSLAGAVRIRLDRRRHRRRILAVALATCVVMLAVALAVPASRASLLRFFHLRGVPVTLVDRLPPLAPRRPLGTPIGFGRASFRLLLPSGRRPDRVYAGDGGYWLRYPGLLLFEFESGVGHEVLKKVALGTADVEYVRVGRRPGIWIGSRHGVYMPGGSPRAAGHSLIWEDGSLTLRLEAAVGLERAIAIARTVR
jgi:hypothetical protein